MKIMDLKGREMEVTNLPAALGEAEFYMGLAYEQQTPQAIAASKERQLYWTDIYQKLLQLQSDDNHFN